MWQPDSPKFYTLLLAFQAKVFCHACLLEFGLAAATHYCQGCRRPFDYTPDMYCRGRHCTHCKAQYEFPYYQIMPHDVAAVRQREFDKLRAEAEAAARHARLQARSGGGGGASGGPGGVSEEELLLKVGECMVNEECPICGKAVGRGHRAHVEKCLANPPPPRKKRQTVILGEAAEWRKEAAAARRKAPKKKGLTLKK